MAEKEEVPDFLSDENIKKIKEEDKKAKKKAKKEKKERKEPTTFNALDEKFQLTEEHEPDHIFPEELEMMVELRKRIPVLQFYSDKFIAYFLFARRHDIDEVEDLIQRYLSVMEEFKFDRKAPSILTEDLQELFSHKAAFHLPGTSDKHGRMLLYFFMARNKPGIPVRTMLAFSFWEVEWLLLTEPLSRLRNGLIWICDLKDFSIMKNLDFSANGRAWGNYIGGTLPSRIRNIYMVNQGFWMRGIMQAAKLILPKKLTARIVNSNTNGLKAVIPEQFLLEQFGGKLKWNDEEYDKQVQAMSEVDKKIKKVWNARRKKIKAWKAAQAGPSANVAANGISDGNDENDTTLG